MRWLIRGALLGLAEVIVAGAGWWLNGTRRDEGPVLVPLTHGHGIHRMDLFVVALGLVVAAVVLATPGPTRWAEFWAEPAGHGPNGIPQTRRPSHDQLVSRHDGRHH